MKIPARDYETWFVVSDVHAPYHHKALWEKLTFIVESAQDHIGGVILAGDFLDLYSLSSHNRNSLADLQGVTLGGEYAESAKLITEIEQAAGEKAKLVYLWGNHEDRYWRFLQQGDNAKLDGALTHPTQGLNLSDRWRVIDDYKDGFFEITSKVQVVHGLWTGTHAAKQHLDRIKRNVLFGHTHRVQHFSIGTHAAWNIGWLGDPNCKAFGYVPRWVKEGWSHGFAEVLVDRTTGYFWVNPITAFEGKFAYGGKLY